MELSFTRPARLPAWVAGPCLVLALQVAPAQAQVKVFKRPPTPDEIRAALKPAPKAAAQPDAHGDAEPLGQVRTRSIEWTNHSATAPQSPSQQANVGPGEGAAAFTGDTDATAGGTAIALPVNFDAGSAKVSAGSTVYIEAIAQAMLLDPTMKLMIEGHTNSVGSARANLMLSWERAFTVFRVLVDKYHIDPSRLQPIGKGSAEPLEGTSPEDGTNRRVQFRPLG